MAPLIIDYIQMSNFLSHAETMLKLEKGINIIYGKNGAGKSSIVDAIRFALFGEKRGDKIAGMVRSNTSECSVTIGFRIDERYYEVYRSMTLGSSGVRGRNSWMKVDGEMAAETSEGVTREIQHGLKIPRDIFLNSVFVRQGEMDALISETQANREKLFSRIIGIDALSDSAQKIKTIRDDLRLQEAGFGNLQERVDKASADLADARKQLDEASGSIASLTEQEKDAAAAMKEGDERRTAALERKTRFDTLSRTLSSLRERRESLERAIKGGEEKLSGISYSSEEKEKIESDPVFSHRTLVTQYFRALSELKTLEASSGNVKQALGDYEREKERLDSLEKDHARFTEIEQSLHDREERVRELQPSRTLIRSLENEIEADVEKKRKLSSEIESPMYESLKGMDRNSLQDAIAKLQESLRETDGERRSLKERTGGLQKQLTELRKNKVILGDNRSCPVCGTELDDRHLETIHEGYQHSESELLEQVAATGDRVALLNERYSENQARLEELRKPHVEKYLSSLEEYRRLAVTIEEKNKRLVDMKPKLQALELAEEALSKLKKEKEGLQKAENDYNSVLYAIKRMPVETLREKRSRYASEEEDMKGRLSSLAGDIGFEPAKDDITRLDALIEKHEALSRKEREYRDMRGKIDADRRSLSDLRAELREKEDEIQGMGDPSRELSDASAQYRDASDRHSGIKQALAAITERRNAARDAMERSSNEVSSLGSEKERLARIREAGNKLEKLRAAFDRNGIQALIRKDSSVSINNMTRDYLSSFNFEFDDVRIDENFNIRVINNGVEEPLDALSGGERISLAIAVRLAIARYLTGRVSTVIMDEPTNFLDEDRRNNLKDIIRYSLKDENMVQQMIMITHHAELTSAADSSYEVTKNNGVSSVVPG